MVPPLFVSILKPLCGLQDDLEANLESFMRIRGVDHEVILSVADANDPAIAVAERLMARYPSAPWRLMVGGDARLESGNRKVARLIAARPHARGDVLMIADDNVRIEPDDVARTVSLFANPKTGCVSNVFTGAGAASFGARIESLHLLSFVAPGVVLAAAAGVPCVVGKSMAISAAALDAVGGFERFARVLAEDQAIGLAVREAGFEVVLSPIVVRNVVVQRTLRRALARQVRWNKIRYSFSKWMYTAELLVNPLPLALLAWLCGAPLALPLITIAMRMAQVEVLAHALRAPMRVRDLLLVPLFDLLLCGSHFVPYASDRVTWRGYTARLGRNTALIDVMAS